MGTGQLRGSSCWHCAVTKPGRGGSSAINSAGARVAMETKPDPITCRPSMGEQGEGGEVF